MLMCRLHGPVPFLHTFGLDHSPLSNPVHSDILLEKKKNSAPKRWENIQNALGKKAKSVLQNAFKNSFFSIAFVFFRVLEMFFLHKNSHACITFSNVRCQKLFKKKPFTIFVWFYCSWGALELHVQICSDQPHFSLFHSCI